MTTEINDMDPQKILSEDKEYFNIETSGCNATFAINASKKGIDKFLELYGKELPPKLIDLKDLLRPQRRWASRAIELNEEKSEKNPSPYKKSSNQAQNAWNLCSNRFHINFIDEPSNKIILYGVMQKEPFKPIKTFGVLADGFPIAAEYPITLTVNKKGWKKFLSMLKHLRDQSHWFYVTVPNGEQWKHLPFQLTPYESTNPDNIAFKAFEFIQLNPTSPVCLNTKVLNDDVVDSESPVDKYLNIPSDIVPIPFQVTGNNAGLILLTEWIELFAKKDLKSTSIVSQLISPSRYSDKELALQKPTTGVVQFRKIYTENPEPVFFFAGKINNPSDLYIFGNTLGLLQLAKTIEFYAFLDEKDAFPFKLPPNPVREYGNSLYYDWNVLGGEIFSPRFAPETPFGGDDSIKERKKFINEKIVLDYVENKC